MENVALWHERDISHSGAERVALPDATILLDYMQSLALRVVRGMVVHADRMRENLDLTHGALFSQRVLLALVAGGMQRDEAYRIAQEYAQRAWDERTPLRSLLEERRPRAGPRRGLRPRRTTRATRPRSSAAWTRTPSADRVAAMAVSDDLKRVPLFSGLSQRQLKQLAKDFHERRVRPGTELIKQGEMSGIDCFVIAEGEAAVKVDGIEVARLGPGRLLRRARARHRARAHRVGRRGHRHALLHDPVLELPQVRQEQPGRHVEAPAARDRPADRGARAPRTRLDRGELSYAVQLFSASA